MPARYEIFADEAWTHGGHPLRRYWCFYGGIFGSEADLARLDTKLRRAQAAHGLRGEIKWSRLTPANYNGYCAFVDCLLDEIELGRVRFRQMLCDRADVRVPDDAEQPISDLDVQFKLCYQFLKHSFGLKYLDQTRPAEVLVRFDTHSSQKHKDRLVKHGEAIPKVVAHPNLTLKITFVNSDQVPRIQVCDLMIGACGSRHDNMHKIREPGQRGMKPKQANRLDFCKRIYERLRAIDAGDRGSKAFQWIETTGKDGDPSSLLAHKFRTWKFKPRRYQVDEGWQNINLDKQGQFVRSQVNPTIRSVGANRLDVSY